MTTPAQVKANFIISGSPVSNILVYDKYKTKVLSPVVLQISNSSQQFAIQFYPTGSSRLTYMTFDEPPVIITKQLPYVLPSSSATYQSAVQLKVSVDSTGFDSMFDNSQEICSVKFNLVAVTSSFAEVTIPTTNNPQRLPSWTPPTTTNTGGTNTGGTNTGGNNSGTTSDTCVCLDTGVCGEFCTSRGLNCATDSDCISQN